MRADNANPFFGTLKYLVVAFFALVIFPIGGWFEYRQYKPPITTKPSHQKYLQSRFFNSETTTHFPPTYCLTHRLRPIKPNGAYVDGGWSYHDPYDVLTFDPDQTGWYKIRIRRTSNGDVSAKFHMGYAVNWQ